MVAANTNGPPQVGGGIVGEYVALNLFQISVQVKAASIMAEELGDFPTAKELLKQAEDLLKIGEKFKDRYK